MRPRSLRRARVVTGAMLLGAAGAVLAPAGPDALVPFKLMAAAAAQEVGIAVVVDFGNGTVTSTCAHVPAGSTDEQALAAVYPVVMNSSGLICDINNVPTGDTSQCLTSNGSGEFYFWAYFQGTSSSTWQYSSVGPAESSSQVEGWRFQDPGPDNPSAPAPGASASYAAICDPPTTTTTPPPLPPTTTPPAVTPAAPTATTAVKGSTTSGGTGAAAPKSASKPVPTATTAKGTVKPSAANPGPATTTTLAPRGSTTGSGGSTTGTSGHRDRTRTALASASVPRSGSGGAPILPLVLIGVVIALLAGFGYYRWRQRPAEE